MIYIGGWWWVQKCQLCSKLILCSRKQLIYLKGGGDPHSTLNDDGDSVLSGKKFPTQSILGIQQNAANFAVYMAYLSSHLCVILNTTRYRNTFPYRLQAVKASL